MREIPRYIGNRPQASLLHRDILTELRSFFSLLPKQNPMYVRNTHTHTHAPADWNIPLYIFFACFSLPTLGSSRIHYLGATTYRLVYSTALLHLHLVLLSFLPYLLPPNNTSHLPHTKGNPELYPSKQYEKAKISHILVSGRYCCLTRLALPTYLLLHVYMSR